MLGVSKAAKLDHAIQNIVTTHVARTARRSRRDLGGATADLQGDFCAARRRRPGLVRHKEEEPWLSASVW